MALLTLAKSSTSYTDHAPLPHSTFRVEHLIEALRLQRVKNITINNQTGTCGCAGFINNRSSKQYRQRGYIQL
jgi:hypothetical protein